VSESNEEIFREIAISEERRNENEKMKISLYVYNRESMKESRMI